MIDDWLKDLFSPDAPAPGSGGGANFAERFAPALAQPLGEMDGGMSSPPEDDLRSANLNFLRLNGGRDPTGSIPGGDDGAMLPPGASPMSGRAPASLMPPTDVPMPRARPDIEGILAGRAAAGGPPMGAPPPGGAAPPGPAGGGDIMARLAGMLRPQGVPPGGAAPSEGAQGVLGRLIGMDASGEKRLRSTIAGGFAGGNPAFAGGAFMKGAGGGLSGGLKSDKEDTEAATAADDKAQKQANFDRAQTDKEATQAALRKLYGDRGTAAVTRANAPGAGSKAWNKPAHERYKDAMKLIQDERKAIYGQISPIAPKAEREAAKADADKRLQDFTKRTLKTYGIDENGAETGPPPGGAAVVPTNKVVGDQEGKDAGLYPKGTYDDPAEPMSQEEFDALPAGTIFKNPADGRMMTKRG